MKLAIVTAFPPSKVTLNEYAYHLVKHFRKKDCISELILLTDQTKKSKQIETMSDGCKITVNECWSFNHYTNILTIINAIKKEQPDAILFNLQFMKFGDKKIPAALGLLLPMICKLMGIPTIVLLHNILEQVDLKKANFAKNKLIQSIYNNIGTLLTKYILKADRVVLTMEKYVTILKEKYHAKNVVFIPHGTFELPKEPTFKILKKTPKILAFGKFGTYKKVELLIEAVVHLRKTDHLELEIVIAGTDNPNAIGYLAHMKKKYTHVPKLKFTGYVKEESVSTLFEESSVVVFPYTSTTGSSGVLHQAGSYGKAVIMPNLGDLSLLVQEEGYKGDFFEPENMISLAKSIKRVVTDDLYRITLEKANYKAATAYPMSKITDMYLSHFQHILSTKKTYFKKHLVSYHSFLIQIRILK